jgi:branched-chain amino acid transport system permease protein
LRNFGEWRLMVYSLLLIFILFFLPNGIVAPTWNKIRHLFTLERP